MLPFINPNATTKNLDTTKQLAAMRNQMAALRDGVEDELSHISYDQLDANLKKKIDELNSTLISQKNQTDIVAQTLQAKYITAEEISAQYATFGTVNALAGRISVIESDYITTTQLNAVTIDASQITSGTIKANQIDADDIASELFKSETVICDALSSSNLVQGKNLVSFNLLSAFNGNGNIKFQVGQSGVYIIDRYVDWVYDSSLGEYVLVGRSS